MSAVATIVGDMNVLWLCVFLSFFVPTMLMKKEDEEEQKVKEKEGANAHTAGDLQLTERGSTIVAVFINLIERIDSKIPKFSEWQEVQKIKKSLIQSSLQAN